MTADFASFRLDPKIDAGIKKLGYATPTPIQRDAIPHALRGADVLGLAQTGTGKTAAFALPMLQRLLPGPRGRLRALVLAPTRELAEQIHESFRGLGGQTGLRSMTVYGGVGMGNQLEGFRKGVEIVVACPGRLLDHIGQGAVNLSAIEILVLDEADRMFDMGFLPDIRKILKRLPAKRQNLLFSATMPDDIRHLAHEVLRDPVTVQVDYAVPLKTVAHALYPVAEHLKGDLVSELLRRVGGGSILVFTRTKHRAKRLAARLEGEGCSVASLQGNLSQSRRKAALDGFRSGRYEILVATDIAARGIDVSQISHVINYDIPDTTEAYTHRIGRTGRAANTGDAFTLVTSEDEGMVRSIERVLGASLERRTLEGFDYGKRSSSTPAAPKHRPSHGHGPQHAQPRQDSSRDPASGHRGPSAGPGFRSRFGSHSSRLRLRRRR